MARQLVFQGFLVPRRSAAVLSSDAVRVLMWFYRQSHKSPTGAVRGGEPIQVGWVAIAVHRSERWVRYTIKALADCGYLKVRRRQAGLAVEVDRKKSEEFYRSRCRSVYRSEGAYIRNKHLRKTPPSGELNGFRFSEDVLDPVQKNRKPKPFEDENFHEGNSGNRVSVAFGNRPANQPTIRHGNFEEREGSGSGNDAGRNWARYPADSFGANPRSSSAVVANRLARRVRASDLPGPSGGGRSSTLPAGLLAHDHAAPTTWRAGRRGDSVAAEERAGPTNGREEWLKHYHPDDVAWVEAKLLSEMEVWA